MGRIFVGNLPNDIDKKGVEKLFYKYGRISFIDLKSPPNKPAHAFVELENEKEASYAVRKLNGSMFDGHSLRVEFSHRSAKEKRGPPRRSDYRVIVSGMPPSGSWQDLKDHMRPAGEVCYADVARDGTGIAEFNNYDDMAFAVEKLDYSQFKSHKGEVATIRVKRETRRRSRSPRRSPRRSGSRSPRRRSYSPRSMSPRRRSFSPRRSISPRGRRSISPRGRRSISPRARRSISPRARRSISPRARRSISPRGRRSISPRGGRRGSLSPRRSLSPTARRRAGSISPRRRRSLSPRGGRRLTPSPRSQSPSRVAPTGIPVSSIGNGVPLGVSGSTGSLPASDTARRSPPSPSRRRRSFSPGRRSMSPGRISTP